MIRGQTRPIPVAAEVENPNEIKAKFNASIHNRFDIEVVDAKTGEIKQRAQAENVICNQFWSHLLTTSSSNVNNKIQVGSGSGTPSSTDTSLFGYLESYAFSFSSAVFEDSNDVASLRFSITISEQSLVGSTLTEIGIASYSGDLLTHAMLKDMNGNQISISKTDTDIVNVYATIFYKYDGLINSGWTPPESAADKKTFFGCLTGFKDISSFKTYINYYYNGTYLDRTYSSSLTLDAANKKIIVPVQRVAANAINANHKGLTKIQVELPFYIKTVLPSSWYAGSDVGGEAVATGDGTTKDYSTKFLYASNVKIYVDGVEQTNGVSVDPASDTVSNNIHFAVAPASGAAITADYHTDIIAKDENHVFDFSMEIQLGEYTA